MILSVDLNPLLKRKFNLDAISENNVNIPNDVIYGPGGNGIELTYLLNALNEEAMSTGFLGGVNGTSIKAKLENETIPHDFLQIKDETAESIIISVKNDEKIIINSKGPRITRDEYENFLGLYNKLILSAKMICCVGELPINTPKDVFFDLVVNANILGKQSLIAIKGEGLKYCLEAKPYLVVMEKYQLEDLTNLKLDYEYEIIKAGLFIIDKNVKIVVISLGNRGSIVLTKEFVYRVDVPFVEKQHVEPNYGYMIGGYALALVRNYDFETFLKVGQACGIVNSFKHRDEIDMSDIKRIMGDIEITKFNY
ncbi:PfkB family carbohydrate kinase [Tissierella sp. Yu-01]|uniref:1-phosphofructokinase family hexose kinase n=1 Tax=Tissierella sp. Yu-01 TaxID=3035694 RepID=UPI00240DDD76|nr:PfkB family carbohydrate kinase [Tissierella sp. Yu-01]WFA09955.1 PfkB family carbohydrate kinase [Tissierella sp. Yu-01]